MEYTGRFTMCTKIYYKKTVGQMEYTGRFTMCTKIYYKNTVGHVFTIPVQIEGTTQNIFFSSK